MGVNLSIKNVPVELAEAIKAKASANHRSLQGELMAMLTANVGANVGTFGPRRTAHSPSTLASRSAIEAQPRTQSLEEIDAALRKLFPIVKELPPGESSVDIVRRMRDELDARDARFASAQMKAPQARKQPTTAKKVTGHKS
jgi:plasmid stability protein